MNNQYAHKKMASWLRSGSGVKTLAGPGGIKITCQKSQKMKPGLLLTSPKIPSTSGVAGPAGQKARR